MKALYQCAKIAQGLQYNTRPLFALGLLYFYSKGSLRKMCPYSELFWLAFSYIRTEYGEIRSISLYWVRMRENANQNNSEYEYFLRRGWMYLTCLQQQKTW